jgi:AcrR family transcriptional regulator
MFFMGGEVNTRRYDAAQRRARSASTRQSIIVAGRDLMMERGYRGTTVAAIAGRAGVNIGTVYELVGRKPVLLRELIEQAISGADHAVVPEERDHVKAMRAETDPVKKLVIYAGAIREIQERMAPLFVALRDAASTEPDARSVCQEICTRRANNMRKLVLDLHNAGGLRADLSIDDAADNVWATNSSELYVMMVVERGWSPRHYEQWLADSWCRLLLPRTE